MKTRKAYALLIVLIMTVYAASIVKCIDLTNPKSPIPPLVPTDTTELMALCQSLIDQMDTVNQQLGQACLDLPGLYATSENCISKLDTAFHSFPSRKRVTSVRNYTVEDSSGHTVFKEAGSDLLTIMQIDEDSSSDTTSFLMVINDLDFNILQDVPADSVWVESADDSIYSRISSIDWSALKSQFESAVGAQFSFASIVDNSGSVYADDLEFVNNGLTFLYQNLPAVYRSIVVKFGTTVDTSCDYTTNAQTLIGKLTPRLSGRTAFYDAVHHGLVKTANEDMKLRFVLAFTDGKENNSSIANRESIISLAQEEGLPIITLGVSNADKKSLRTIAYATGGFYLYVGAFKDIGTLFEKVKDIVNGFHLLKISRNLVANKNLRLSVGTAAGRRMIPVSFK